MENSKKNAKFLDLAINRCSGSTANTEFIWRGLNGVAFNYIHFPFSFAKLPPHGLYILQLTEQLVHYDCIEVSHR